MHLKLFKQKKLASFSLIELIVSMAIIAVIMVMLSNVLVNSIIISRKSIARSFIREEVSDITDRIAFDIRNANRVSTCSGEMANASCTILLDAVVTWKLCPSQNNASVYQVCKVDASNNILYSSSTTLHVSEFQFEQGYSSGGNESRANILITLSGEHSNSTYEVKNVLRQLSVSTRNYQILPTSGGNSSTPSQIISSVCGNGVREGAEICDDGNRNAFDSCNNQCLAVTVAACRNGIKEGTEECDDGNSVNTDFCSNSCKLPVCGNAIKEGGEACDDGNTNNIDTCPNSCQAPVCGNGIKEGVEACDDGNTNNNDACFAQCHCYTITWFGYPSSYCNYD